MLIMKLQLNWTASAASAFTPNHIFLLSLQHFFSDCLWEASQGCDPNYVFSVLLLNALNLAVLITNECLLTPIHWVHSFWKHLMQVIHSTNKGSGTWHPHRNWYKVQNDFTLQKLKTYSHQTFTCLIFCGRKCNSYCQCACLESSRTPHQGKISLIYAHAQECTHLA